MNNYPFWRRDRADSWGCFQLLCPITKSGRRLQFPICHLPRAIYPSIEGKLEAISFRLRTLQSPLTDLKRPAITVQGIHFEDFDGRQFERLVFAFHLRYERWLSLEWYGQSGSDLGRDIWGVKSQDNPRAQTVCIQCVNHKNFPPTKVRRDLAKILKAPNGKPDLMRFVCSSSVSADARDKLKKHANEKGIYCCDIWSGSEFEERLRMCGESLLKRFCEGVPFPDAPGDLKRLSEQVPAVDDREVLGLFSRGFDRPAFSTPFHGESSLPAFKQAITDTIEGVNTGVWRTRAYSALLWRIGLYIVNAIRQYAGDGKEDFQSWQRENWISE